MAADLVAAADWRDAAAYRVLLAADRSAFAWEWLRRSPAYRAAWRAEGVERRTFGLCAFDDPAHGAVTARPFWRADVDRAVLLAEVVAPCAHDLFDLARLRGLATVIAPGGAGELSQHILISDGLRSIRIDLPGGGLADSPVALRWHIDGLVDAGPQVLALRQLMALVRTGSFARSLHPRERRASRWVEMLRVHDALAAGAAHREIAGVLFDVDVSGPGWRASAGSWRLRVQRLAAGARGCFAMGPTGWLGGRDDLS